MNIGNRVYYNIQSGNVIFSTGEIHNGVKPREENEEVGYIDINYGAIDYAKSMIVGIDVETRQPILEMVESEQDKRIRELEDELLLAADAENGGIL
ncbi:hypothetical protein [Metasolibacillus meyeri]|uniref:hypothetical protein n=1 Tax=Metasolibacillus meyeri TaxID=1071052 RepID=UPI000D316CB8|nr:hypothetical protein [Metasolibacillus meyeri]